MQPRPWWWAEGNRRNYLGWIVAATVRFVPQIEWRLEYFIKSPNRRNKFEYFFQFENFLFCSVCFFFQFENCFNWKFSLKTFCFVLFSVRKLFVFVYFFNFLCICILFFSWNTVLTKNEFSLKTFCLFCFLFENCLFLYTFFSLNTLYFFCLFLYTFFSWNTLCICILFSVRILFFLYTFSVFKLKNVYENKQFSNWKKYTKTNKQY